MTAVGRLVLDPDGLSTKDQRPTLSLDVALAGRCSRRRLTRTCAAATARRQRRANARTVILHRATRTIDAFGCIGSDGPVFGAFS